MKKLLAAIIVSSVSVSAFSGSTLRFINNTGQPLQAVWQAGGCTSAEKDWWGDTQWSMCKKSVAAPGEEVKYDFNFLMSDRSLKIFKRGQKERIGYCNSMDDQSLTISDDGQGKFIVEGC